MENKEESVLVHRRLDLSVEASTGLELLYHLLVRKAEILANPALDQVHGLLGASQDLVRGKPGIREHHAADARTDPDFQIAKHEGAGKAFPKPLREGGESLGDVEVAHKEHEFVPAESPEEITGTAICPKTLGDLDQQTIARFMPEVVVDLLEAVDVEKEERRIGRGCARSPDALFQLTDDDGSVGRPGQMVMGGLMEQLDVDQFAFGDDGKIRCHEVKNLPDARIDPAVIRVEKLECRGKAGPDPDRHDEVSVFRTIRSGTDEFRAGLRICGLVGGCIDHLPEKRQFRICGECRVVIDASRAAAPDISDPRGEPSEIRIKMVHQVLQRIIERRSHIDEFR